MVSVAVVYFSGYGHTRKLAEAVGRGAQEVGATVSLIDVCDVDMRWDDLSQADAIVFGAPTYMGGVPADFKRFMDNSAKVWFGQGWKNKISAGFTNSGSYSGDKLNTLIQLAIFAAQHGMIWVGTGLLPGKALGGTEPHNVNRLGSTLGAMAQSDDLPAEVTPPSGDLDTAALLGKRVAVIAQQFSAGRA
jgi:multimeric flavodoxin WrbA